jgi:hypothetical protein
MWYNGGMRNLIQHIVDGFRYSRNAFLVYFFADFIFIAGTTALQRCTNRRECLFTKHFILASVVDSNIEPETEDDSEEC